MRTLSRDQAARALRAGEAVIMPTDTVYGLGVAVDAAEGPDALFRLKGRPEGKPVAWLVEGPGALDRYGADVPAFAHDLARRFWPGGLTLVVRASDAVPVPFRSAAGTIGLRMPDSPEALALIEAAGCPLAVTSANPSGTPAPAFLAALDAALAARTAGVVEGPCNGEGVASTVVDCTGPHPTVLRQGALDLRDWKGQCHD